MARKGISILLILAALTVAVLTAGCTATQNKDVLYGNDVFNPAKFSMATYSVGIGQNTAGQYMVLAYPGEDSGNRLDIKPVCEVPAK